MGWLIIAFSVISPVFLYAARKHWRAIDLLGLVTWCYILGIVVGNVFPRAVDHENTKGLLSVLVPLSLPLLLFATDLRILRERVGGLVLAALAGVVAIVIAVVSVILLFGDSVSESWKIGSMMMAVYTGGTANLNAIGLALEVDDSAFVLVNAADVVCGGAYFLFLLGIGARVFEKFLRREEEESSDSSQTWSEDFDRRGSPRGLLLSVIVVALSVGISFLATGGIDEIAVLLSLTSISLLMSTVSWVRNLPGCFALGNYFLLVFCVAIGTLADLSQLREEGLVYLGFVAAVLSISLVLHSFFCWLLRLRVEDLMISSTAGVFGPAFIAPVANSIGRPRLIPLGLAISLMGFAVGSYGALALAELLQGL